MRTFSSDSGHGTSFVWLWPGSDEAARHVVSRDLAGLHLSHPIVPVVHVCPFLHVAAFGLCRCNRGTERVRHCGRSVRNLEVQKLMCIEGTVRLTD